MENSVTGNEKDKDLVPHPKTDRERIAELELTVAKLTRRMVNLENEFSKIRSMPTGGAAIQTFNLN
jgi:hypothetical protein